MDLGTVKKKLENNMYRTMTDFANDVRCTYNNAMTYNGPGTEVHQVARDYAQRFEEEFNT